MQRFEVHLMKIYNEINETNKTMKYARVRATVSGGERQKIKENKRKWRRDHVEVFLCTGI